MTLQWNFRFDRYGKRFHYRLYRRPGSALIVMLPGLRGLESKSIEYYNRLTWNDHFDASTLFVADPGVTSVVRGTWFQGTPDFFGLERVAYDIRQIISEFSFQESDAVLYGSSQGGFAALGLGAYLTSAKVLAECPQTDIRLFNMRSDVNRVAQFCYGVENIDAVSSTFLSRLKISELYKLRGYVPRAKILVKESDTHCLDLHIDPLQAQYPDRISVKVHKGELGQGGHVALPKQVIVDEINSLKNTFSE